MITLTESTTDAPAPTALGTALGIDLGGTAIKWAVLTDGAVAESGTTPTPREDERAVLDELARLVSDRACAIVGLALPGPVTATAEGLFVPNLAGRWTRQAIAKRLGRVELVNDGHAFALAESRLGAGRDAHDVVCLTLGTGVGGGVVLGGRLHRGALGRAGEIGHLTVDPDGPPCVCGNRGCLEAFASGPAIVAATVLALAEDRPTLLRELAGGDAAALSPALVGTAAARGDALAREVLGRAGIALGIALANVSAVLAPQVAVVGGGVAGALDAMRPAIDDVLRRRAGLLAPVPVVAARLGASAGAIGAAHHALEERGR
jgi:glucokinase